MLRLAVVMGVVFLMPCGVLADKKSAVKKDNEAAVRASVKSYIEAYQKRDAPALAAHWAKNAVYVSPVSGKRVQGRQAIEAEFAAMFKQGKGGKLKVDISSIRFPSPDVAIEEGQTTVTNTALQAGRATIAGEKGADKGVYTAIYIREDGQWKLDSVRERVAPAATSSHVRLQVLAWMIGKWVDKDDHFTVYTDCHWSADGAYLTRTFQIEVGGKMEIQGTQIIGWNPADKRIESWMFDSDGGYSTGVWRHDDNRWIIRTSNVLPNGKRGSSVNVMTVVDKTKYKWQSSAREVDGEILPNTPETIVVRQ